MKILITICARGGSKGVPGKNIKLLAGKPLIAYSIEKAKQLQEKFKDTDIALSTDSEDIKAACKQYGIFTNYLRPEFLSQDSSGKVETIQHLVNYVESNKKVRYDLILDLDVSAPLRSLDDLCGAIEVMKNYRDALNLFSVSAPHKNPYFNMVEQQANGYFSLVKMPKGKFMTRQSAPQVFDINASFYLYRRAFFDLGYKSVITPKAQIYECKHVSFDIDRPLDFDIMEYLILNNKLDFSL
jgi:CMP-N,N'-diacetyllegionaminic acid synthase